MYRKRGISYSSLAFVLFGILFFSLFLGWQTGVLAETKEECSVTLNPSQSLQDTIDRVQTGSVICLSKGTWEEKIHITKSLTIRGETDGAKVIIQEMKNDNGNQKIKSGSIKELFESGLGQSLSFVEGKPEEKMFIRLQNLQIRPKESILQVKDASMEVSNCNFAPRAQTKSSELEFSNSSESKSRKFHVSDSTFNNSGIEIVGSSINAKIANTVIKNNSQSGINIYSETFEGKENPPTKVEVESSIISGNNWRAGITARGGSHLTIKDSQITNNSRDGILLAYAIKTTIRNSVISKNTRIGVVLLFNKGGKYLSGEKFNLEATVKNSEIRENGKTGFFINFLTQATITNSEITGHDSEGIMVCCPARVTIKNNYIRENKIGVDALGECTFRGYGNKIRGNETDFREVPESTQEKLTDKPSDEEK